MTLTEYLATEASQNDIDALKEAGAIKEVISNGIEITGYQCAATDVIIPNEIDGKKVAVIGTLAFWNYSYSDSVGYLNNGIRPVNYELTSADPEGTLTSIAIPDNVIYVSESAFSGNKISRLKLSSNLQATGTGAFSSNNLITVIMPNKLFNIGAGTFSTNKIENLKLSPSLVSIGKSAFSDNNSLKTLEIPDNVGFIGEWVFSGTEITNIILSENSNLSSVGYGAFACLSIPENTTAYRIINLITEYAFACSPR